MIEMRGCAATMIWVIALGLAATHSAAEDTTTLITIDGTEISQEQFELEVYNEARRTFYHGRPTTEADYLEFRRGIVDKMVDRALLLIEADRRGIVPDHELVAHNLAVYEDSYSDTERWQAEGEGVLERLREFYEDDSVLSILEQQIRAVAPPEDAVLRHYYEEHPEKFTEPEQLRVSVILLAVAPSSVAPVWEATRGEGAELLRRIRAGESFEELARMHSADPSAKNGGDMGYLHAGMLSDAAHDALEQLEVGGVSSPVTVLEGVAIFRLTDRREAKLQPLAAVQERAAELWQRDEGERLWRRTISDLRSQSDITIDEAYLQSLPASRM